MDDKTTALIEKLAEKFGTTAEHLWGVLLHQAPISGAVSLVGVALMIVSAFFMVRFVKEKQRLRQVPKMGGQGALNGSMKTLFWLGRQRGFTSS